MIFVALLLLKTSTFSYKGCAKTLSNMSIEIYASNSANIKLILNINNLKKQKNGAVDTPFKYRAHHKDSIKKALPVPYQPITASDADVEYLELDHAGGHRNLDHIALLLAQQGLGYGRTDRELALAQVGLVLRDNRIHHLLVIIVVQ